INQKQATSFNPTQEISSLLPSHRPCAPALVGPPRAWATPRGPATNPQSATRPMSATTPRLIHIAVHTVIAPLSPSQTYLPSTDEPVAPSNMYAITSTATIALPMSNIVCLSTQPPRARPQLFSAILITDFLSQKDSTTALDHTRSISRAIAIGSARVTAPARLPVKNLIRCFRAALTSGEPPEEY